VEVKFFLKTLSGNAGCSCKHYGVQQDDQRLFLLRTLSIANPAGGKACLLLYAAHHARGFKNCGRMIRVYQGAPG
jgi:hypothetical protein